MLVRSAQWLLGGSLGVLIFTGNPLPDPQIVPHRHPHVAALARPDPAPLSPLPDVAPPPAVTPSPAEAVAPVPDADLDVSARETPDECSTTACIDQYLWSLYQRAPKVDTIKVPEQIQVLVKKKGKSLTVAKTVMKAIDEDFAWKDAAAAERAGMPLPDYVIGGMDPAFRLRLYRVLRALDEAGLVPGITSGFRDDYRQSIAAGLHAASDRSYHGGSRRGGYGHGLAVDLVSVKGDTRSERLSASADLWKWIDAHGQEFGIGRPYLDRDPPHVGPIDGQEYADHRRATVTRVALQENKSQVEAKKLQPATSKPQVEAKKPRLAASKPQTQGKKPQAEGKKKPHQLAANKPHQDAKKARQVEGRGGEHRAAKRAKMAKA